MPLILLGLIVIIGIVLYALVIYGRSGDEDARPVSDRFSGVFRHQRSRRADDGFDYDFDDDDEASPPGNSKGDSHTMYFPSDAELEKRKRNIH